MNSDERPVGIFDSGVGGLSVLREAVKVLPHENFIYFGDSANAPYGTKTREEVMDLTHKSIKFLMEKGVKAIVIACNTATAAAEDLRKMYKGVIPILGIEPALKPAAETTKGGVIVVMATPRTLSDEKYAKLEERFRDRNIIRMPSPDLVDLVESGRADSEETVRYINGRFKDIDKKDLKGIVLGCTHFPFAEKSFRKVFPDVPLFDGAYGISKHLLHVLEEKDLLNRSKKNGTITIFNSKGEEMIAISHKLLEAE